MARTAARYGEEEGALGVRSGFGVVSATAEDIKSPRCFFTEIIR